MIGESKSKFHTGHGTMARTMLPWVSPSPWILGTNCANKRTYVGLKTTNVENWIEIDETYLVKYQLKRKVYQEHWDEAVAVLPGCGEGAFEALELLKETLVRRYPTMFKLLEPHIIHNLVTGDVWDLSSDASTWEKHHPLEIMGLLATDDFFLLFNDAETGETTLRAAATCFPGMS